MAVINIMDAMRITNAGQMASGNSDAGTAAQNLREMPMWLAFVDAAANFWDGDTHRPFGENDMIFHECIESLFRFEETPADERIKMYVYIILGIRDERHDLMIDTLVLAHEMREIIAANQDHDGQMAFYLQEFHRIMRLLVGQIADSHDQFEASVANPDESMGESMEESVAAPMEVDENASAGDA